MKKNILLLIICTLILSACNTLNQNNDIVQSDEGNETESFIIPSAQISDADYQMILPFRPSKAREAITNQIANRIDIHELEDGLRRQSVDVYDPKKYIYEEGQYFSTAEIYELIDELNPDAKENETIDDFKENPRIFSHMLEQNYLVRKDNTVELAGISIGIALKSVYRFTPERDGPSYTEEIDFDEMMEAGKHVADRILSAIRQKEELMNVPVMIALYQEEKPASAVPGNYVAKTVVGEGEQSIGKWTSIKEKHVLYSAKNATGKYADDYQRVKKFGDRVTEYFPNYVGLIGEGFYQNDQLQRTTIRIPIEFNGRSEIVGFTQYVYGVVEEIFQVHDEIEIVIESMNRTEAILTKKSGETKVYVHVMH